MAAGFRQLIPSGFFDTPAMRNALGQYDFGIIFQAILEQTGLSQFRLAELVGLTQSRVSAVVRGERSITGLSVAARISTAFGIPPRLLGFYVEPSSLTPEEVSWVDRRDFITVATVAALGSGLHAELDRLGGLLPRSLKPVTRKRIGVKDVEAIESVTAGYRRWDLEHGSGLCRDAALVQLHEVLGYEHAECSDDLRPRLWVATAELASMTGWLAYDIEDHDAARRLWTYALWAAYQGQDHPRSTDLSVNVLLDMAHQALHLWRPAWEPPDAEAQRWQKQRLDEALRCAQTAAATASTRRHPATQLTAGYTAAVTAWCFAARGDARAMERAIGQSEDLYAEADLRNMPPWASFVTDAEIRAQKGHSAYLLSTSNREFAPRAVDLLSVAVDGHVQEHARSRAVTLPPLAGAYLQAGDYDTAAAYCAKAIREINGMTSQRCYTRLRDLDRIATQYDHSSTVSAMRAEISETLRAA
ncbi:helix-turn-helix transcriptional regulator [Nocardia sp. NEAU-G5]|uniref:Helix-turn-helix transcriptional regulator n=1 Tax=Nocardia albiluteola TaxID=2842303 RepID=A0ABS6AYL2_9NOCA|nr:helix-turn-helix transcriptional regulator [Nocardia albiluteola]MBU3063138.1 helix-turn-helix transcriptional regulator [Nocardia albiluteola]